MTCELVNSPVDALPDVSTPACMPVAEICGDGIDQDCDGNDPACPPNDKAAGAIDIGAGGTFMADLRYAGDDSKPNGSGNCGGAGGRDVYYKIHLDADEAIYLDTFGSDFDSVIRVFHGTCVDGVTGVGVTTCHNDACATTQTQAVWDLTAGDVCVVVDQNVAEAHGSLVLHVERGKRSGVPLMLGTSVMGNTSLAIDQSIGVCTAAGPDLGYHFTSCPNQSRSIKASTCNGSLLYDSAIYARSGNGSGAILNLACNNDDVNCITNPTASTITFTAQNAHLFWIIVDAGTTAAGGAFQLDTSIQ